VEEKSVKKTAKNKEGKIGDALMKVALGYQIAEVTEEYAEVNGELKLTKRKKTKKDVPPDLKAVQMLLSGDSDGGYLQWTDEELQAIYQLQTALDQQLAAIADNIHRANKVYLSVQKLMPQSWFDSMNYKLENSSIFNMDTVQIRELYQTQLGEIREKMLAL
jgi:hypothetical protein